MLENEGLRDNTIVIVTSDHGEMLVEKGMIQKHGLYGWSARISLFVDVPGVELLQIDTPVSLRDVPVTLIDIAGHKPIVPLEGQSLLPAIHGEKLEVIPITSKCHRKGIMHPSFMV